MSKFVRVKTELRDPALIKRALDDLRIRYKENERYTHRWSGYSGTVPFLVELNRVTFALRPTAEENFEVIGDDMQMRAIRAAMAQVEQRYAYHSVLTETAKAGFELVDESVGRDNVIRLTVRRWS
jgi:hypothetical protein